MGVATHKLDSGYLRRTLTQKANGGAQIGDYRGPSNADVAVEWFASAY